MEKLRVSWDNFPYYINEHTKNILVECVASHLKHKKCTTSYGARLSSSSGRIMLQSVPGTELYRERTVKALAQDLQDFGEDESESDDSAGSVEETCSESEVEDDNDAVNEEEWTSSAEAKSDCRDYDAVDLEANAQAALKKLLPCSLEQFEKLSDRRYYTAYRPMQIGGVVWSDLGMHFLRDVSLISTLRSGIGDNTVTWKAAPVRVSGECDSSSESMKNESAGTSETSKRPLHKGNFFQLALHWDRVKYIGPSICIEADDRCLFISLFLAYKDDDNPPIPDSLSPDITDFLRQCFKKPISFQSCKDQDHTLIFARRGFDATQRPDAKTLLSHPWILKSKPALNSFRHSGAIRSVQEDVSVDTVILNGDKQGTDQNSSVDKTEASVADFEAVAREYLEKVADLLLEFSQADTSVKSYMCSQSLLNRLFQMFNRIELPILLKILKCIDNLSTDPNCLENLQRADAIKYLIPNLELKDGPLVDHIHSEAVYEHHPRPKQLIVENDLPQKLLNLIEERRDGQSSGGQHHLTRFHLPTLVLTCAYNFKAYHEHVVQVLKSQEAPRLAATFNDSIDKVY
uniref:Uncharacterized protein n=1 Tax=Salix viminalis TaxID=40686 RepID=A0A6N2M882_SALVM